MKLWQEARERVRRIQDAENAWHVTKISVLSLINNLTINSELTKGV